LLWTLLFSVASICTRGAQVKNSCESQFSVASGAAPL